MRRPTLRTATTSCVCPSAATATTTACAGTAARTTACPSGATAATTTATTGAGVAARTAGTTVATPTSAAWGDRQQRRRSRRGSRASRSSWGSSGGNADRRNTGRQQSIKVYEEEIRDSQSLSPRLNRDPSRSSATGILRRKSPTAGFYTKAELGLPSDKMPLAHSPLRSKSRSPSSHRVANGRDDLR